MNDDFCVALRVETMARGLQLGDQLLEVVDLTIEDDGHRAVFVEQGLLPGGDIDDGQAPMRERAQMYLDDLTLVKNIIADGCEKARELARETMRDVRESMGLEYH